MSQVTREKKSGFWKAQVGLFWFHWFLELGPMACNHHYFLSVFFYCVTNGERHLHPGAGAHIAGRVAVSINQLHLTQASECVVQRGWHGGPGRKPGCRCTGTCPYLMTGRHGMNHKAFRRKGFIWKFPSCFCIKKGFYPEEKRSGLFYSKNAYSLKIKCLNWLTILFSLTAQGRLASPSPLCPQAQDTARAKMCFCWI